MEPINWGDATALPATFAGLAATADEHRTRRLICACCKHPGVLPPHGGGKLRRLERGFVRLGERYADGLISDEERQQTWEEVMADEFSTTFGGDDTFCSTTAMSARYVLGYAWDRWDWAKIAAEMGGPAALLAIARDIFGRAPAPAGVPPDWLPPTAVSLARGIHEVGAYWRLPVLADAIEEAGCDDAELLAHCRGGGGHVKGCWAVDLVLGVR